MSYKILITGSRDWSDINAIYWAVKFYRDSVIPPVTIMHGACPTGADQIADRVASQLGLDVERYPADWSQGKQAGPERNQLMVDLKPDIVLGFPLGESRGTRDCMRRATAAGITVRNHGYSHVPN